MKSMKGKKVSIGGRRIQIGKELSEGSFGVIFIANDLNNKGIKCALKVQPSSKSSLNEITIMEKSNGNENIVSMIGYSSVNKIDMILMEMVDGSDHLAMDIINRRRCRRYYSSFFNKNNNINVSRFVQENFFLSGLSVLNIFKQVCSAVRHFHSHDIAHLDLKIENVLCSIQNPFHSQRSSHRHPKVFGSGNIPCSCLNWEPENRWLETTQIKICDLGSAITSPLRPETRRQVSIASDNLQSNTTPAYRAPEMIEMINQSDDYEVFLPSDIWALGCLLYKLLFLRTPFESPSKTDDFFCNPQHDHQFSLDDDCDSFDDPCNIEPLAIINGNYILPNIPKSSPAPLPFKFFPFDDLGISLSHLVGEMLSPNPRDRPSAANLCHQLEQIQSGGFTPRGTSSISHSRKKNPPPSPQKEKLESPIRHQKPKSPKPSSKLSVTERESSDILSGLKKLSLPKDCLEKVVKEVTSEDTSLNLQLITHSFERERNTEMDSFDILSDLVHALAFAFDEGSSSASLICLKSLVTIHLIMRLQLRKPASKSRERLKKGVASLLTKFRRIVSDQRNQGKNPKGFRLVLAYCDCIETKLKWLSVIDFQAPSRDTDLVTFSASHRSPDRSPSEKSTQIQRECDVRMKLSISSMVELIKNIIPPNDTERFQWLVTNLSEEYKDTLRRLATRGPLGTQQQVRQQPEQSHSGDEPTFHYKPQSTHKGHKRSLSSPPVHWDHKPQTITTTFLEPHSQRTLGGEPSFNKSDPFSWTFPPPPPKPQLHTQQKASSRTLSSSHIRLDPPTFDPGQQPTFVPSYSLTPTQARPTRKDPTFVPQHSSHIKPFPVDFSGK